MPQNSSSNQAYGIVEVGGKQYMVRSGDTIKVERFEAEEGQTVELRPVLAVSDGTSLHVGTPALDSAKVTATVKKDIRGPKVVSYKRKRRKGYHKKTGHRQNLAVLKIETVSVS